MREQRQGRQSPHPQHGGLGDPTVPPPHPQVKVLEAENQRKSRELGQLQARGSQAAQRSQQEALELQRQVADAQAAGEAAQEEVGGQGALEGQAEGQAWPSPARAVRLSTLPLPMCSRALLNSWAEMSLPWRAGRGWGAA